MRQLALPVRQRGRNAVGIQPHPAYPEGRARAETADRQLGVLRVVLPVTREQSGHAAQALGQVYPGGGGVLAQIDQIERGRRVECRDTFQACGLHGDTVQGARGVLRGRRQGDEKGQRQRGAR